MNIACIVTGDRHATAAEWEPVILSAFWLLKPDRNNVVLIHGAQKAWDSELNEYRGIDYIASQLFARTWSQHTIEPYPADWRGLGRAAGPIRNEAMLARLLTFRAEYWRLGVLAFHNSLSTSEGTGHMVKIARAANVTTRVFTSDGSEILGEDTRLPDFEVRPVQMELPS